jgi:SSS family solute:Na+ symporter
VYFFRRAKTSRAYFLADRKRRLDRGRRVAVRPRTSRASTSSGWPDPAPARGLAVGHFEWLAAFMCMTLGWVFVPFYLRSSVYTMPEFLERRYGPACRWYLTTVSVLAYVFTKISVSLYAGALVLRAIVGWDFYTSAA